MKAEGVVHLNIWDVLPAICYMRSWKQITFSILCFTLVVSWRQ